MSNTIWSDFIQGTCTLFASRQLRFDDIFAQQYKDSFEIDALMDNKILEIGCGPGALCGALHRWYPSDKVVGLDRDSEFIRFAIENVKGVDFLEGEATDLPFESNSFDITISNTVSEHIEPDAFFKEQYRVLKEGGTCIVISSLQGINIYPNEKEQTIVEQAFWEKVENLNSSKEQYDIGRYKTTPTELPLLMERYGFKTIKREFIALDLSPDNPKYSKELSYKMINANRYVVLDYIDSINKQLKGAFTIQELEAIKEEVNSRYDKRLESFDKKEKKWETYFAVIMIVIGKR